MKTFPIGGVHPSDNKQWSNTKPIEVLELPDVVNIPLGQHIGAPATAKVAKGDKVLTGQLIGEATGFMSANIHSPISGTVTAVDMQVNGQGLRQMMITIKREGDEWMPEIDRTPEIKRECELDSAAIIAKIKDAGIVGMGGATFPTHVKLSIPNGCKAEYLIINGVECEPYLTSDHRTMLERGEELLIGTSILMKAVSVDKAVIGIENNKPDAIKLMQEKAAAYPGIEIVPLKVKYPQGGEKQLIEAITGRRVPSLGLPIDVGVVVQNVGTALAVYEAIQKNKPLVESVVTVTGQCISQQRNLSLRVGTSFSQILDAIGGIPKDAAKFISGGPMMGKAVSNIDASVLKGTSAFLMLTEEQTKRKEEVNCVRCAKCIEACPMGLEPWLLNKLSRARRYDDLEKEKIYDCIECGCCLYTCPSNIPLLDIIRISKAEVTRIMRSRPKK